MKKPSLPAVITISWLMVSNLAITQGLNPETPLHQYTLNQWTVHDGLASNNLTQIMQSDAGYLWITSFNGLHRFDGRSVDLYTLLDIPFLESNAFYGMYQDNDGVLWFATQASGLINLYEGEFNKVLDSPKSIRSVFKDSNGHVWVGSNNFGAFYIEDSVAVPVDFLELQSGSIYDITEDHRGTIWFATENSGLIGFQKDGNYQVYNHNSGLASDFTIKIKALEDKIVVGTNQGLSILTDDRVTTIDILNGFQINDIFVDQTNKLWYLATESGLVRYNPLTGVKEVFEVGEGLPVSQIKSLCQDHEGSLWMSTSKGGILRLKNGNFINYDTQNGLDSDLINVIYQHQDQYYIGTDEGAVNLIENDRISKLDLDFSFDDLGIRDFLIDDRGALWIASYKGILKVHNGQEQLLSMKDGLPANDIRRLLQDSKGRIWAATRSGGVVMFNQDEITIYNRANGLESNYVLSIEEHEDGSILIGTNAGGLSIISPDGSIKTRHISNDDSGLLIFNIHTTEDQTFLITSLGIYLMKDEGFMKLNFGQLLVTRTFFDMDEDQVGNYWITSNDGLIQVRKDDLIEYQDKNRLIPSHTYDESDGMGNSECTGATRMLIDSNGSVWVPTIGGAAKLKPEVLTRRTVNPNVYITGFSTEEFNLEGNLNGRESIKIVPGNHRYQFKFTALSYLSPNNVRFRHMLEPFDQDWIDNEAGREVVYTNLSPGNYRFKVMATPDLNGWNYEPVELSFVVRPMFHQTFWFYLLLVLIIGLIVFMVDYYRVNNVIKRNQELKKLNDELDRFVYSTSHDLRAPLASILGLTDLAQKETSTEEKNEYLNLIRSSAVKLDRFIHEILDYSRNARYGVKSEPIDFKTLLDETFKELEYQDKDVKINKEIKIDQDSFNSDKGRIKVVFNNIISNSIRYRNNQNGVVKISVKVKVNRKDAHIVIADNGKGIKKEFLPKIFDMFFRASEDSSGSGLGLYIVKECIDKLGGNIKVESEEGKGTRFSIDLPQLK